MGIERSWIKIDPKSDLLLNVSETEWKIANEAVKKYIADYRKAMEEKIKNKELPKTTSLFPPLPFKVERKALQKTYKEFPDEFQHSFIVIGDKKQGFKLGAMARGKPYIKNGKEVREGILGHGAFGVAKIVQWEDNSQNVVKIESSSEHAEEYIQDQAKVETQILSETGVLEGQFNRERGKATPWIDYEVIKNKNYKILKKAKGIQMKDFLDGVGIHKMDSIQKCNIAIASAIAVQGLHNKNILHCDIKPSNFMIDVKGRLSINQGQMPATEVTAIDFGLSKKIAPHQTVVQTRSVEGTPFYMSPETGMSRYSKSTDIYALGRMFKYDLQLEEGNKSNPEIEELVEAMLNKDPSRRPSIEDVIDVISEVKAREAEKLKLKAGEERKANEKEEAKAQLEAEKIAQAKAVERAEAARKEAEKEVDKLLKDLKKAAEREEAEKNLGPLKKLKKVPLKLNDIAEGLEAINPELSFLIAKTFEKGKAVECIKLNIKDRESFASAISGALKSFNIECRESYNKFENNLIITLPEKSPPNISSDFVLKFKEQYEQQYKQHLDELENYQRIEKENERQLLQAKAMAQKAIKDENVAQRNEELKRIRLKREKKREEKKEEMDRQVRKGAVTPPKDRQRRDVKTPPAKSTRLPRLGLHFQYGNDSPTEERPKLGGTPPAGKGKPSLR